MKTLPFIVLGLSLLLWTGCGTPENNDPATGTNGAADKDTTAAQHQDNADGEMAYACPMHPDVTGKQGDTCSKCGMDLEKVE